MTGIVQLFLEALIEGGGGGGVERERPGALLNPVSVISGGKEGKKNRGRHL